MLYPDNMTLNSSQRSETVVCTQTEEYQVKLENGEIQDMFWKPLKKKGQFASKSQ